MKKFFLSVSSLLISLLITTQSAFASCDIGTTLFKDTLFGAGLGAGVGGLVLISTQNSNNVPSSLATSALIGAAAGIVVGVVELSMSNCMSVSHGRVRESHDDVSNQINFKPLVTIIDNTIEPPSIQRTEAKPLALNQIGAGVTVEYKLN